jgi:limonene-1,2-epoxide hydrolase
MNPEQVVNAFMAAFDRKDLDGALALVTDDCYYDNVPLGDMRGREKMREFLAPIVAGNEPVQFEVLRQAAGDKVVMNERIDRFVMNGKPVALPVSGVFEVVDGKISFWRDYFDKGMFMKALKGE